MNKITQTFTATATAAEVARNFGRYKELAQRGPIAVTSHGRESVVLVSADEFARLKALDDRIALYGHELPNDIVAALARAAPRASASDFDDELNNR